MCELKCSCGSVYNGETKRKIISRSIEHQQEASKVNGNPLEQPNTQRNSTAIYLDWLHPKTLSIENRYYDRIVKELLETDMVVVRYGQEKVLKRDNGNFVKTNAWKPLFRKVKKLH